MTGFETELDYQLSCRIKLRGTYSYLDTTAESSFERGLYGLHPGSVVGQFKLRDSDSISLAYYRNSDIGELDFDRFDLVYNWRARVYSTNLNVLVVAQHFFLNKHQGNELDGLKIYAIKSFDDATHVYLQCELQW